MVGFAAGIISWSKKEDDNRGLGYKWRSLTGNNSRDLVSILPRAEMLIRCRLYVVLVCRAFVRPTAAQARSASSYPARKGAGAGSSSRWVGKVCDSRTRDKCVVAVCKTLYVQTKYDSWSDWRYPLQVAPTLPIYVRTATLDVAEKVVPLEMGAPQIMWLNRWVKGYCWRESAQRRAIDARQCDDHERRWSLVSGRCGIAQHLRNSSIRTSEYFECYSYLRPAGPKRFGVGHGQFECPRLVRESHLKKSR